jgi:hypothetical protein
MDPAKLYAQFDGDEVDGKRYALGEPLDEKVDFGTRSVIEASGRWATTPPDKDAHTSLPGLPSTLMMSRAELIAELTAGMPDSDLRDALDRKREDEASRLKAAQDDQGAGSTTVPAGPLDGSAADAIDAVGKVETVAELDSLRAAEVAGKDRTTVLAAIDKRVAAIQQ